MVMEEEEVEEDDGEEEEDAMGASLKVGGIHLLAGVGDLAAHDPQSLE